MLSKLVRVEAADIPAAIWVSYAFLKEMIDRSGGLPLVMAVDKLVKFDGRSRHKISEICCPHSPISGSWVKTSVAASSVAV